MRIIRVPIVVVLAVAALAAVPMSAGAATGGGCPPAQSGWVKVTFDQAFQKELDDTVAAGYTVEYLLELFGVPDEAALYSQVALPGYQFVDRQTGDGILCLREMPWEEGTPWFSNFIDNRVAA